MDNQVMLYVYSSVHDSAPHTQGSAAISKLTFDSTRGSRKFSYEHSESIHGFQVSVAKLTNIIGACCNLCATITQDAAAAVVALGMS